MARSSTSFKPGNTFWKYAKVGVGRPEEWTTEVIKAVIDDLNEWLKDESEVSMTGFRGHYGIDWNTIKFLRDKSPEFFKAYESAKTIMASRLTKNKDVHSGAFNRYVRMYDSELNEHEVEVTKQDKKAEAEAVAEASRPQADQFIEAVDKVLVQITERQSLRKIDNTNAAKE